MKSGLIILMLLIMAVPSFAQYGNETITITTYYPSPHGVYGVLTLYPRDQQPDSATTREGDLYYDKGTQDSTNRPKGVYVYNGSVWTRTSIGDGGGGASAGNNCEYVNMTLSSCDVKCNSLGMECFEAPGHSCSTYHTLAPFDSTPSVNRCKCCTLGPSTAPGAITTVSGTNPTCPSGTTEISRFITAHDITACLYADVSEPPLYVRFYTGWKAPPHTLSIQCEGPGACTASPEAVEACLALGSGKCVCSPLHWTMVKCQRN
jgi:hypothetical protein